MMLEAPINPQITAHMGPSVEFRSIQPARAGRDDSNLKPILSSVWLLVFLLVALLAIAAMLFINLYPPFGAEARGLRSQRAEHSPQWHEGSFANPQPQQLDLRGAIGDAVFGPDNPNDHPANLIPVVSTNPAVLASAPKSGLRITWFGHSSALVEIDGARVLTDPIWSDRASPFSTVGPKRWFAPPIALNKLPRIDAVVISHDHYDHLDFATIQGMRQWSNLFVVPIGIGAHLERWGIPPERVVELDWWESKQIVGIEITATPARHASGRLSNASNRKLWAGFALIGPTHRVWYSGDTAFHEGLSDIGDRLGPFDVTLIEAGQYNARWPDVHLGPEQAIEAHLRVRGKLMIPVHWGLFNLAPHTWTEPAERVLTAAACRHATVRLLQPGDPEEPADAFVQNHWWPHLPVRTASTYPVLSTKYGSLNIATRCHRAHRQMNGNKQVSSWPAPRAL